jgi:ADP-ribose pyrophosphatase YjhB (NUDIX family)
MTRYAKQKRLLLAVDCIIFGFDGHEVKLLVVKRAMDPEKGKWSLMGGFIRPNENLKECANRVLKQLTGIEGVYLEQLRTFSKPERDPLERTVSVAYFALIDINKYEKQLSHEYSAEWFLLNQRPKLIFDHEEMVRLAQKHLRYKASLHPVLFELLPEKFTIPQLQELYEGIYDSHFDNRNFSRKVLSTGLLVKQKEKDKKNSKKGAFFYRLDRKKYKADFQAFLNFIPNPDKFLS